MAHLDQTPNIALKPVPIDRTAGELLSVTARNEGQCVVLAVHGEADPTTCPLLRDQLVAHVRSARHLIVDLGGVSFFGAAGLTVLVVAREAALLAGCRLCVVAHTRQVRLPLMITGLDDVFDLHLDLASALVCPLPAAGPRRSRPR